MKKRKLEPERACTASATFSSAVKSGRTSCDLERCARGPSRARAGMSSAVSRRHRRTSVPRRALSAPEMRLTSVVLPAPLGPMRPMQPARAKARLTSFVDRQRAESACEAMRPSSGALMRRALKLWRRAVRPTRLDREGDRRSRSGPMEQGPMIAESRQPLAQRDERRPRRPWRPRATDAAEDRHRQQFARALPAHDRLAKRSPLCSASSTPAMAAIAPAMSASGELVAEGVETRAPRTQRDSGGSQRAPGRNASRRTRR